MPVACHLRNQKRTQGSLTALALEPRLLLLPLPPLLMIVPLVQSGQRRPRESRAMVGVQEQRAQRQEWEESDGKR